jgi:multidrug efflux pump subunit AcrA (membrane-fusion protein)
VAPILAIGLLALTAFFVQLSPTPDLAARLSNEASGSSSSSASPPRAIQAPPDSAASPVQVTAQIVTARRGTLTESVTLSGRIGAVDEVPVSFQSPQRVSAVNVKPGDLVTAGQVLVQADGRELARNLADARDRLTAATTKLNQAQDVVASQQRVTERRQAATQAKTERSVADADAAVRRAQTDLERVRAGATIVERRAAETTVASARAGLARAEADLVRAQKGPSDLDLRQAQQQVTSTQLALTKAQDDYKRLSSGPDPMLLRAAQQDYINAQNVLARAQIDVQRLVGGDPVALAAAQRDVQRAQTALRLAQMAPTTSSTSSSSSSDSKNSVKTNPAVERAAQAGRKAAIQDAQFTLQGATERLQALQAGPPPAEVMVAQRNMAAAAAALDSARARLEIVQRGPDQATINQARANVDAGQIAYDAAIAHLEELQAGPEPEALSAAQAAYASAQAALRAAQTQQQELLARPTQAELADANDKLKAAQDAFNLANTDTTDIDTDLPTQTSPDIAVLKQSVDQEQSAVQALERDIIDTNLVAPSDGTVIAVTAKAGVGTDAGRPVVVLARRDAEPIVLAELPTANGSRLTVGQKVVIQYGGPTGDLLATIGDVTDAGNGNVRVQIRPTWPQDRPTLGTPASIRVITQERPDVVILPTQALVGSGNQRSITVLEGDQQRTVQVQLGLVTGGDAEIVNGIEPDTNVLIAKQQPEG